MAVTGPTITAEGAVSAWEGFRTGLWPKTIDVRDFIQQNYEPHDGDATFLAPATARTQKIWDTPTGTLRRGETQGGARRLADPQLDHGPRAGLHRS